MNVPFVREPLPVVLAPRALVEMQRKWEAEIRYQAKVVRERLRGEGSHTRVADHTRGVASNLLKELRSEAGLPVRPSPPPPPPHRKVDKKQLADARLLMMLAQGRRSPPPKAVKYRCGACVACMRHACGECVNCLDKKRFGGRGCKKQACAKRPRCLYAHEMLVDDAPDSP